MVGTVTDNNLFTSAKSLISPFTDGDEVFTRLTVPFVKTYNKSYSFVFVIAIVETLAEPDKIMAEFVGVTFEALAIICGVKSLETKAYGSSFQSPVPIG